MAHHRWTLFVAAALLSLAGANAEEPHPLVVQVGDELRDASAPFAMFVELTAKPGEGDALASLFLAHTPASRAETGNLAFVLHRDAHHPDRLVLYEKWRNLDALDKHLATPHMLANLPRIQELTEKIDIEVLPVTEGADDVHVLRLYLDFWVAGWSPGAKPWDAEALRPLFAEGAIKVFDDVEGGVVVLESFDAYAAKWGPGMAGITGMAITLDEQPDITVVGDLAYTTFVFSGGGTVQQTGKAFRITQYGTHVWRRIDGVWKIVHEHLTTEPRPTQG